jgi:hypothetical protein
MYFDVSKTAIYELNTIIGNNSHLLCVKNKFCLGKACRVLSRISKHGRIHVSSSLSQYYRYEPASIYKDITAA